MVPFTLHLFRFSGRPIEDEKILNHLSHEELSIHCQEQFYRVTVDVTIERDRIKDAKSIIKEGRKH